MCTMLKLSGADGIHTVGACLACGVIVEVHPPIDFDHCPVCYLIHDLLPSLRSSTLCAAPVFRVHHAAITHNISESQKGVNEP